MNSARMRPSFSRAPVVRSRPTSPNSFRKDSASSEPSEAPVLHAFRAIDVIRKKRDGSRTVRGGDRSLRQRLHAGRHSGLSGLRVADGRCSARHDARRDRRADRCHAAIRGSARSLVTAHAKKSTSTRPAAWETRHLWCSRLGGRCRNRRPDDQRARSWPHRRHARQTRSDPGIQRESFGRRIPASARSPAAAR